VAAEVTSHPMAQKQTDSDSTSTPTPGSKGYTAPKGRPTRARGERGPNRRAFGPIAQWITFAIALIVAVTIIILLTGGGDFNPFNEDEPTINPLSAPAAGLA
jgi:hypothetical protein